MNSKTYITEANAGPLQSVAVIVVYLAGQLGLDMSPEVAAVFSGVIIGVGNIVMRALKKKGLI